MAANDGEDAVSPRCTDVMAPMAHSERSLVLLLMGGMAGEVGTVKTTVLLMLMGAGKNTGARTSRRRIHAGTGRNGRRGGGRPCGGDDGGDGGGTTEETSGGVGAAPPSVSMWGAPSSGKSGG